MPQSFLPPSLSGRWRFVAACLPALLLAACGGGGGGGAPTPMVSELVITSTNQKAVAADALDGAVNINLAQAGSSLVTGVQASDAFTGVGTQRLASAARKLIAMTPTAPQAAVGAQVSQTVLCAGGGSVSVSGNLSSASTLVPGDSLVLSAASCVESIDGVTTTLNGSLAISVVGGFYDSNNVVYPVHLVLSLTANHFSIAIPGETDVTTGDMVMDETDTSATTATVLLSGTSLTNSMTTAAGTHSDTLKNYSQALTVNGTVVTEDVSATLETTNPRLGSVRYTVTTPTPLTLAAGVFTAGSLKAVGHDSALLLTVTGNDAFSLQLDANGDGIYESTTSTTLSELRSYL